ncbi:phospho-N-acetylmuramoyl-pentapeptide-transferase [Candidatus Poribacteria bacterium]|nr:phospho-N-acetylmuramoyl-pentapeptide-transferase [Candidatus Poribacteria bacterium]
MLYFLLYEQLQPFVSAFRLFQYITFRAVYATILSFLLVLLLGPATIRWLQKLKFGQYIRREGPESHYSKQGTPTMGGLLIAGAWLASTVLWARLSNPFIHMALFAVVWFGTIGFLDDWSKIKKKQSLGLTGKAKLALQFVGAAVIAIYMTEVGSGTMSSPTTLAVPFFKTVHPELPVWIYVPFAMIAIVGSANAVNLTDGLDGLAITCSIFVVGTLAILAYLTSHLDVATYLAIPHNADSGELVIFGTALVGAGLGFLWWNCYPAQVFMGDTGSMAIGGAIGTMAVAIKQELLLVIMGGIFVAEAVSVIAQVLYFKRTGGKRLLRMSPLHHHFEKGGMPEPKVTVRFWIVAALLLLVAVSTLKLR